MARVKRAVNAKKKRRKVMDRASGYGGAASVPPIRGRGEGASSCSNTTPRPSSTQGKGKEPA